MDNMQQQFENDEVLTADSYKHEVDQISVQQGRGIRNNRKLWIIIGIVAGVFAIIGALFCVFASSLNNNSKLLVAERAYTNWAWGFSYDGKAIFNDGTIYEWEYHNDDYADGFPETREDRGNWILKNGTPINRVVSEKDMNEIKNNIDALGSVNYEKEGGGADMGSSYISIWKNNEEILLKESGDWRGDNTNKEAQNLIKLITKYLQE